MATIKVKFRPSIYPHKEGVIYYQIIHGSYIRQFKTQYRIFAHEWDGDAIITVQQPRSSYLQTLQNCIERDIRRFQQLVGAWESTSAEYTADDIVDALRDTPIEHSLRDFTIDVIAQLQQMGRLRTSETYRATLSSFMSFCEGREVLLADIDSELMQQYEAFLRQKGIIKNTTSFYMRNLRAIYNRAVERNLIVQRYPFKNVYTGIDKTTKRALTLKVIKKIKSLDLRQSPSHDFARDMFMFSFYTRGMSFIDMAYLRKSDLSKGILTYCRRKTGQKLFIKWEECMQAIVDKYNTMSSPYLLPILTNCAWRNERMQYLYTAHKVNHYLKEIGCSLQLSISLTTYVARHTWASVARSKNVPLSVISEGMGHDSEATTRIYLASLDTLAVDKANKMIIKLL